jgi:hypothetical protein
MKIRNLLSKNAVTVAMAGLCVLAASGVAMADPIPVVDLSSAAADLTFLATDAIGKAIPVGVLILGAIMGWKFFKRFVK